MALEFTVNPYNNNNDRNTLNEFQKQAKTRFLPLVTMAAGAGRPPRLCSLLSVLGARKPSKTMQLKAHPVRGELISS